MQEERQEKSPYLCVLVSPREECPSDIVHVLVQANLDLLCAKAPLRLKEILERHDARGPAADDRNSLHDGLQVSFYLPISRRGGWVFMAK